MKIEKIHYERHIEPKEKGLRVIHTIRIEASPETGDSIGSIARELTSDVIEGTSQETT